MTILFERCSESNRLPVFDDAHNVHFNIEKIRLLILFADTAERIMASRQVVESKLSRERCRENTIVRAGVDKSIASKGSGAIQQLHGEVWP